MSEPEKGYRQEIAELEHLLAEKKKVLAAEGRKKEERGVFQEAFRETFREKIPASNN